jgi:nitrate/TMAO reductase-like tetraheme cytochrome c subunit
MQNSPYAFVNETEYNQSVHGNQSVIGCTDCHTNTSSGTLNHTGSNYYPPQSGLKWCEDCHVVNQTATDPMSHNITSKPQNYNVTYQGQEMSVLNVTDCTACHDATMYNKASATFNKTSGKDCRFCHTFPEREPESPY